MLCYFTPTTTLPENYPKYILKENENLSSICSRNLNYQGNTAVDVEPTYPQASENAWSGFQVQVPDEQPVSVIPMMKRQTQKQKTT